MKTIFVAGGDGFCGWPLSLRLSKNGNRVIILDNLSRRKIDVEMGQASLTPIHSIDTRIECWNALQPENKLTFEYIDLSSDYDKLCQLIRTYTPECIIQLAEQRSAPYSMKNANTKRYTVQNNLSATHNLLSAIVDESPTTHFIHLGTMGVYGYGTLPNTLIPEGYVDVKMKTRDGEFKDVSILHPAYPGSIYHLTKTQEALMFQFYAKNYKLRITDLHQGIIWGLSTKETDMHPQLLNRFDYDSDYGTILNRFIIQSANNIPLTIYGSGGQTRAFIHIENSMDCIELAIKHPPNNGDRVKILNQMTETHRVSDIAKMICNCYPNTKVQYIKNPRNELEKNELNVCNQQFLDLGLKPIHLNEDMIKSIYSQIKEYNENLDEKHVMPKSIW